MTISMKIFCTRSYYDNFHEKHVGHHTRFWFSLHMHMGELSQDYSLIQDFEADFP